MRLTAVAQLSLVPPSAAGLHEIPVADANDLLARWGHYLGPCRRPFGQQAWALVVGTEPVSVAVSASTVAARTAGYARDELVELARLCAGQRWATRVMLRLWRQVAAPAWPHWAPRAAVAYSLNDRHDGRVYRFDGWSRVTARAGTSGGGGGWSRPRPSGHAAHGAKTLWLWRYDISPGQLPAAEHPGSVRDRSTGHTAPHPGRAR